MGMVTMKMMTIFLSILTLGKLTSTLRMRNLTIIVIAKI